MRKSLIFEAAFRSALAIYLITCSAAISVIPWKAQASIPHSRGSAVEESAEAGVAGAADGELRAVGEDGDVSVLRVGLDLDDALQVDDVGAVNAEKTRRVERGFQARDGLLLQVLFAFGCKGDVIVLRFHVFEFRDWNDEDARAIAHGDAVEILRRRARGGSQVRGRHFGMRRLAGEAFLGAVERGFEAVGSEGLQKIIHGVDFEGFDSVAVERGDEDYAQVVADQFEDFEAVEFGHLNIEEKQIGL